MTVHYRNNPTTLKMHGTEILIKSTINFQTVCTVGDTFDPSITLRGGCPYTPVWSFGDGTTATGTSVNKADYANAGPHTVVLTIPNITYWLTGIDLTDDKITGDFLSAIKDCVSLTSITVTEALTMTGALSNLTGMTNLATLKLGDRTGVTGDMTELAGLTNLTSLCLSATAVIADISALATMTQLTYLDLHALSAPYAGRLTGDLASISGLVNLTSLNVSQVAVTGELSDANGMTAMQFLQLHTLALTGDLADIPALVNCFYLELHGTSVTPGDLSANVKTGYILIKDMGWSQAQVDALLLNLYTNRAVFSHVWLPRHYLEIHGTNAAPSGIYQDDATPSTGLEYVYKLANDPDGDGFIKWDIVYTGGTAP